MKITVHVNVLGSGIRHVEVADEDLKGLSKTMKERFLQELAETEADNGMVEIWWEKE